MPNFSRTFPVFLILLIFFKDQLKAVCEKTAHVFTFASSVVLFRTIFILCSHGGRRPSALLPSVGSTSFGIPNSDIHMETPHVSEAAQSWHWESNAVTES